MRPIANPSLAYVEARAASLNGDPARAAQLLGALAEAAPADRTLARKALAEAIAAGDMRLALQLAPRLPADEMGIDARLLLVAEPLRRGDANAALAQLARPGQDSALAFLGPLIRAWVFAERRDPDAALAALDSGPANTLLAPFRDENRAFLLLKARRPAEAEPFARKAVEQGGAREARLRLALADAFLAAGDRTRALAMVERLGTETGRARQRIAAGRGSNMAIDSAAEAFAEVLLGLAVDLNRLDNQALAAGIVQVARLADPGNSAAAVLLALLLDGRGRPDQALAVLRSVPAGDALAAQVRDTAVRILVDEKRLGDALALAEGAAAARDSGPSDHARLGDVLHAMKRYDAAAAAFQRAIDLAGQSGPREVLWPLYLLQASAYEEGGRWPQARAALEAGLAIAPDQPLLLNFLGYAKLERGEQLDLAEAMIRKASALAPEDASITDSLGWALFKRGRLPEAIETLQRAAAGDPGQAEIHEHLGDALYAAGRRFEARFAWSAALITAEEDIARRVRAKLETGLTPTTAAP